MKKFIYLDYQATTPVAPEVWEVMVPYFCQDFGNAASRAHAMGWQAAAAVEVAREQIAQALGARPEEIIFTSGATESNNLALLGVARAADPDKNHIVTVQTEHAAVLDPCGQLEQEGFNVTYLPVNAVGELDLEEVRAALKKETLLISVMAANNEVGTLASLQKIGALAQEAGVLFHTDAAQAAGKVVLDMKTMAVDFLSAAAHKFYGPKGAGFLYVRDLPRRRRIIKPLHFGGGHEQGLRSGTLNVPAVVGMGAALQLSEAKRESENARLSLLRTQLWQGLRQGLGEGVKLNGPDLQEATKRLSHNLNVCFKGVEGNALMAALKNLGVSSGSACASATAKPSHVLRALGLSDAEAKSSLRFSLGRPTTPAEIEETISLVVGAVKRLSIS